MTEAPNQLSHADLVLRADKWLHGQGCKVTFKELCTYTRNGEQPDNIGWTKGSTILIECKTSRQDFFADKYKKFRMIPEMGMGDWRFYLCPPKVIMPHHLPEGWGLIWCYEKIVKKIHGIPKSYHGTGPLNGHKISESQMLVSALRRLQIRGHLEEIYMGVPVKEEI